MLLEMAVLASDPPLSPVTPEILAVREFRRGTLQLMHDITPFRRLGIEPPPLHLLINRVYAVSSNGPVVQRALHNLFADEPVVTPLITTMPIHRLECRRPKTRKAPAAMDTMCVLASELLLDSAPAFQSLQTRLDQRVAS